MLKNYKMSLSSNIKPTNFEERLGRYASLFLIIFSIYKFILTPTDIKPLLHIIIVLIFIGVPFVYLYGMMKHKFKAAKTSFQIWTFSILVLSFSILDKILKDFAFFFKFLVPAAAITLCMLVGLGGLHRKKESNFFIKRFKFDFPRASQEVLSTISAVSIILACLALFICDVCIAKYIHDFYVVKQNQLQDYWFWLFSGGLLIGFFPALLIGLIVGTIIKSIANQSYKLIIKNRNKS